jgi:hypothetical protein
MCFRFIVGVRVYRLAMLLLMGLGLAGCAGQSIGCSIGLSDCAPQQQETDAKAAAADAAAAAQDDAQCRAQGLQPDTPPYERCRTKLADQRAYTENSDRAAVAGRLLGRSPMNN